MNSKVANTTTPYFEYPHGNTARSRFISRLRHSEFLRYFVVSLIAFVLDLAVFSASLRLMELPWAMAATLGFVLGVLVAYILSVRFVFANRKLRQAPLTEMLTFSLVGLGGLGVTQLVLWLGIECLKFNPEMSKFCAAGVTFLFNFVVRKLVLFSTATVSLNHQDDHHDIR